MKKMITVVFVILFRFITTIPSPGQQQKKQTAAVLEFSSADLTKNEATNLTDRFRSILSQTQAFDMIERDKMTTIFNE